MEEKYLSEDEIDLMDYVKVILKRKELILTLFFGAVIVAGILSLLLPKTYKVEAVLETGQIAGTEIESPVQVVKKIESDVYGILIREKLAISEKKYLKTKTENPKDTRLVVITIESTDTQRAKDILDETISFVLKEHQEKFAEKISLMEEEIAKIEQQLDFLKSYKTYADEGIAQLQAQLSNKKRELGNSKMTEMIKPPTVSEEPIKPKPILNMAIAGILGLFVGIFLAFGKEWWEKAK